MDKTCTNCINCKTKVTIERDEGLRNNYKNKALGRLLISLLKFGEVWCSKGLWVRSDGTTEFRYMYFEKVIREGIHRRGSKLRLANSCHMYEV